MNEPLDYCIVGLDCGSVIRADPREYERLQGLLAARENAIPIMQLEGDEVTVPVRSLNFVSRCTADARKRYNETDLALEEEEKEARQEKGEF